MKPLSFAALMLVLPAMPAAAAAGMADKGRAAFAKCASCHQVGPSARSGFGPHLNGIFGRRAGVVVLMLSGMPPKSLAGEALLHGSRELAQTPDSPQSAATPRR